MKSEYKIIEKIRAKESHCPTCNGPRSCVSLHCQRHDYSEDTGGDEFSVDGWDEFYMLQCGGCKSIFFEIDSYFSEHCYEGEDCITKRIFPRIERRKPRLDIDICIWDTFSRKLYSEIYCALNHDLQIIASMGIRTLIDRLFIYLNGEDKGRFKENSNLCVEKGIITQSQAVDIEQALEAGHSAVHRGHTPKMRDVEESLDIAESFIEMCIANKGRADNLQRSIPHRESRRTPKKPPIPPHPSSPDGGGATG